MFELDLLVEFSVCFSYILIVYLRRTVHVLVLIHWCHHQVKKMLNRWSVPSVRVPACVVCVQIDGQTGDPPQ